MIQKDSRQQVYHEIEMGNGTIRITRVDYGWNNSTCLRIQIREESGSLRPGPEIPLENCADVIRAIVNLIAER